GGRIFGVSPAKRKSECAEQPRRKNMVLRQRRVLVPAEAERAELRIIQRVGFGRIVNRVTAKQAIGGGKNVVHAPLPIVISGRLSERERELVIEKIVIEKIRERKQIQQRPCHWSHISAGDAGVVGRYMANRPHHT